MCREVDLSMMTSSKDRMSYDRTESSSFIWVARGLIATLAFHLVLSGSNWLRTRIGVPDAVMGGVACGKLSRTSFSRD
jgi:hypothetical protein